MLSRDYGKLTEFEVADYFSQKGYWVYMCPSGIGGQPADLILAKDNIITLVEVKHCKNDRFTLNRIEANQLTTYSYFRSKGNAEHKIAIKFKSGLYLLDFGFIDTLIKQGIKSVTAEAIAKLGERIDGNN